MKIVTLTTDMRPWAKGESPVLPDAVAAQLVKAGEGKDLRPFPPQDMDRVTSALGSGADLSPKLNEANPALAPAKKPGPAKRYLTRKR